MKDRNEMVYEEAYLQHQHYKENKAMYEKRLKMIPTEMMEFEKNYQERLKIEVSKPSRLMIDDYLENHKGIRYNYDFRDNWNFTIMLEQIVDDYYFGFPTLLEGVETALPEDVGGIYGFYEFLEAYRNLKHPEHENMKTWAESLSFIEYDSDWINERLKGISYKKTEWDKINHERYKVIDDKYRKK